MLSQQNEFFSSIVRDEIDELGDEVTFVLGVGVEVTGEEGELVDIPKLVEELIDEVPPQEAKIKLLAINENSKKMFFPHKNPPLYCILKI